MTKNFENTRFITGMRGYAALSVFFIHANGFGLRQLSPYLDRLVDFGKYGVVAFFVISAFTISASLDLSDKFSFFKYRLRRLPRVAPMYYIVLIVAFALGGNSFYQQQFALGNSYIDLLWHFSFFNWIDVRYQNSLIGVEWSVPIEFFYYLILPFLFFYFKKESKSIFIFLIISGVLSSLGYLLYSQADFPFESFHWSLVKHFFSFTFGVFIYIVFRSKWNYFAGYSNSSLPAILLFLSFIAYIIAGFTYRDLATTLFVGFMILICKARSSVSRVVFENQLILFVGNISYSVYLVHMLFFHHLSRQFKVFDNPFVVLAATLGLSSLTYYFIEKPFINLGKKITIA